MRGAAGVRHLQGALWLAVWGGVRSGGWLWPAWAYAAEAAQINAGDTAWVLVSSALVLMMTAPGLALFYGGLVRRKNVLATLMHSFILLAMISVQWVLWGDSIAFGPDIGGILGSFHYLGLATVGSEPGPYADTIPHLAYMAFQVVMKSRFRYDDSLDVVGVHGIGGTWGALATGLFASKAVNAAGRNGLLLGDASTLGIQIVAIVATWIFAAVVTWIILKILDATMGLRVSNEDEQMGLDLSQHSRVYDVTG